MIYCCPLSNPPPPTPHTRNSFTVRDGDSSEDEIYSKTTQSFRPSRSPTPTQPETAPLLTLSPTSPPAGIDMLLFICSLYVHALNFVCQ